MSRYWMSYFTLSLAASGLLACGDNSVVVARDSGHQADQHLAPDLNPEKGKDMDRALADSTKPDSITDSKISDTLSSKKDTAITSPALLASYFFTSELAYQKIEVYSGKLVYTYFADIHQKCANWIQNSPCWKEADLTSKESALSETDTKHIMDVIQQSGFMNLQGTYGNASSGQKYYPVILTASSGELTHKVTYQYFLNADPMPQPFIDLFVELFKQVCGAFKMRAAGPFTGIDNWQCS